MSAFLPRQEARAPVPERHTVQVHMEHICGWQLPLPGSVLAKALHAMLASAGEQGRCVALHVLRDGRMAEENAAHMGCNGPTNILSFPGEPAATGLLPPCSHAHTVEAELPDILLLSVDTMRRECLLYGQEEASHMLRLLAHGMGHVLGYDHGADMDTLCARMWVAGGKACGLKLVPEDY